MQIQEPTIQDVLEAINSFSIDMTQEFTEVRVRITHLETDVHALTARMGSVENKVESMGKDIGYLRSSMVTKDYLDRKLFEFKGEIMERVDREFVRKPRAAAI